MKTKKKKSKIRNIKTKNDKISYNEFIYNFLPYKKAELMINQAIEATR